MLKPFKFLPPFPKIFSPSLEIWFSNHSFVSRYLPPKYLIKESFANSGVIFSFFCYFHLFCFNLGALWSAFLNLTISILFPFPRSILYRDFLSWLRSVTGLELNDTMDLSCAQYKYTGRSWFRGDVHRSSFSKCVLTLSQECWVSCRTSLMQCMVLNASEGFGKQSDEWI